ncbi:MAG: RNA recognition motif-containing protein [Cirrosporium novae-zelandiae]|nr:MAG: RNA recognition motif-containing protein [Cirrosporium novae-zelandiae]
MAPDQKRRRLSDNGAYTAAPPADKEEVVSKKTAVLKEDEKPDHRRQLFVRSLPAIATTESLIAHFSQNYPIKHAVAVIDRKTNQCKGYGFVTFADAEDAQKALEGLNGTDFQGRNIKVEIAEHRQREGGKKDPDGGIPTAVVKKIPKHSIQKETQTSTKLIIRNLPWSIKEPEQLAQLFRSYGKIIQTVLPKKGPGILAGFGFVIIRGRENAESALEGVNGKEVDGRVLAVDWAVEKGVWEKAQEDEEEKREESTKGSDVEGSDFGEDGDEALEALNSDNESERVSDGFDTENESSEDEEMGDEASPPEEQNSSTLFIRNLPFTSTDQSLWEHFKKFGPVRYARVVMDHETERSKGTGFVCFYNEENAISCLRQAPRRSELQTSHPDSNSAAKHSVLENELADLSGRYTMEGRVLHISHAVNKTEATRLTQEGDDRRFARDKDKRRLYLLSEGTIPADSELYKNLSPSEIQMREASAKQRQTLVRNNPSLHLSLTRLSIRNIPRNTTSKELKALAREAVVGFATDVKKGVRAPLSKEETERGSEEMKEADRLRKQRGKGIVKQAKIVFESKEGTKIKEDGDVGRSRGYGFVEYYSHRWALMGLRWLNGHAVAATTQTHEKEKASKTDPNGKRKRLVVEFAIENAQVIARRQEKETKAREKGQVPGNRNPGENHLDSKGKSTDNRSTRTQARDSSKRKRGSDLGQLERTNNQVESLSDDTKHGGKTEEEEKIAKRNRIIARKRMIRRRRKGGSE